MALDEVPVPVDAARQGQLIEADEEERRRVARLLEEESAQRLASLLMLLGVASRRLDPHGVAELVERARAGQAVVCHGRCHAGRSLPHEAVSGIVIEAARRLDKLAAQDEEILPPGLAVAVLQVFPQASACAAI
jgi:hypothetical protein